MKKQFKITLLLIMIVTSAVLSACMPSEKKIRKTMESLGEIDNYKMDLSMTIPVWGQAVEAKGTIETDGEKEHWVTTISSTGEVIEEYYSDGKNKYIKNGDGWIKEELPSDSPKGSNNTVFDSWVIDSITKADDIVIVKGSVYLNMGEDDYFTESLDMDYKLKMDKRCNIISLDLKAKDISSELSSLRAKLYDIGEASVDLEEVEL